MNLEYILDNCQSEKILFGYNGIISQEFVSEIENVINDALSLHDKDFDKKIARNLFSIAVEQLQNIISYSKHNVKKSDNIFESSGVCIFGYDENKEKYFIKTLNQIQENDKIKVKNKIDMLNSMDDGEKRKLMRELLRSGEHSHDRGAGVGFIEMARRSSEKIEYSFIENLKENLFELTIYI